jgi:hypothetical protein
MRGLGKFLIGFAVVTSALLLYVHEKVEILRVSYRIHEKSRHLSEKAEEFRRMKFEVAQLRSPQNLEKRLGELELPLALPKQIQALRVPATMPAPESTSFLLPSSHHPLNGLLDFLGQWIQVAQARTEQ